MSGRCAICGATPAPYGYRKPGLMSAQPTRGYLWTCAKQACRDAAEARRQAAVNADNPLTARAS